MELQDLLFGELPTRPVGPSLGMHQLSCILHLHTVGIALLKGAHLKVLKDYDRAFLAKAAFRFPPNSGLRGPNPEEMEFADLQLWHEIGDLFEQGWSLDKAVHEVVHVRASLATLLQPRPALPAGVPTPHHPRGQIGQVPHRSALLLRWFMDLANFYKNSPLPFAMHTVNLSRHGHRVSWMRWFDGRRTRIPGPPTKPLPGSFRSPLRKSSRPGRSISNFRLAARAPCVE